MDKVPFQKLRKSLFGLNPERKRYQILDLSIKSFQSAEESAADKALWEKIQVKAFTGWCNTYLKRRNLQLNDITTDFADGVRLINLLEIIGDTTLSGYEKNPKLPIHKHQNVSIAIQFIISQGIKLIGIDPEGCIISSTIVYSFSVY